MIRINLLSESRRPVVARKAKQRIGLGDQDPSIFFLVGGIVLGLLVGGGWHYTVKAEQKKVEARLAKAKKEERELKPILEEVKAFKKKKKRLNTKINIIKDLTARRKGPVRVMDAVSRALPDLVWLSSMRVRGKTVSIKGTAFNTNAVATFIENLNLVPEFNEPNTKNVQRQRAGQTYAFQIDFGFRQFVEGEPPTEEGAENEL